MSTVEKNFVVPRTFKPLSRSAMRFAQSNDIHIGRLGPKQTKWVKSLESGKFSKATGYLKVFDKSDNCYHCCLGVACELVSDLSIEIEDFHITEKDSVNDKKSARRVKYGVFDTEEATLPENVIDEFCFNNEAAEIEAFWAQDFVERDKQGDFNNCDSLKEIRRYVKTFLRLYEMDFNDLTELNDGRTIYFGYEDGDGNKKIIYTHKQIAAFVRAYPQAIFTTAV